MPYFSVNINFDPQSLTTLPSWDIFTLIFFGATVLIYSFFVSRERLALILVSIYSSLALSLNTPIIIQYLSRQPEHSYPWMRLGVFIISFLLFFIIFSTKMSMRTDAGHNWFQACALSFLQVGLLMSSVLLFVPHDAFPSALAWGLFSGDAQRSFWMLAPAIGMLMMKSYHAPQGRP